MPQEGDLVANRYRLEARVGEGAMGVVWRARDERLARTVAVKQISRLSAAADRERERGVARVMREGRLAARLQHPNAVVIYDVAEHDDLPWLVMEYVDARNLATVVTSDGVLADDAVARLGRQAADALTAAHAVGIVHRDVKPANLLIAPDGLVKVTDFGIARAMDEASLSSTGMLAGTPAYLAPEVARGQKAHFRSDVYSLGAALYAAREGHSPAGDASENALAVIHRVASGEILPPSAPGPLTALLRRVLDDDPMRRPQMEQFRDELARTVSENAVTEEDRPAPVVAVPGPTPDSARRPPPAATPAEPPVAPPQPGAVAPPPSGRVGGAPPAAGAPPGPGSTAPPPPVSAAATAPDPHPDRRPVTEPATAVERSPLRRAVPVVGVLGALVVIGVVVAALVGSPFGSRDGATSPAAGGGDPASSAESSDPAGAGSPTGSSEPVEPDPSPQAGPQQAVASYYALMPQRLDEGWQRLTPSYRQGTSGGFDGYSRFWGDVAEVDASEVTAGPGNSVVATITYVYRDGRTVRDRTRFGLVQQDGLWKIDSTTVGA